MIAAYNREIEAGREYNGRQLLELLQNADDEHSNEVYIELNTEKKILRICNNGSSCKPFSFDGIKSLMISNLSPKVTRNYIGNKGLGFRSIINWSKTISINSNNLDIVFSKSFVDSIFDELFDVHQQKEFEIKRNLASNTKPIPFLAIPSVKSKPQNRWTTIISIEYKETFLEDIKEQLGELQDEILLFLNHIDKLAIEFNGKTKIAERIKSANLIYINDEIWTIYEKNEVLPKDLWDKENEKEFYELKIALKDDLYNENRLLFSHFPTKIDINFPFIIHGTFELNSSRNTLNKSEKNKFILEKLVELIIETAKFLSKKEVNYKPLELLDYKNKNNILDDLKFYSKIDEAIEEINVFPCIDNQYRSIDDVIYISDDFSIFIEKVNAVSLFPNMLKPVNDANVDLSKFDFEGIIYSTDKINHLSKIVINVADRVELIYLIQKHYKNQKFELLIDKEGDLIQIDDSAYTPSKLDFNIPSFVKIKFLHKELYQKLLIKFDIQSTEKARVLQRKLKEITNIQSYEPAQVLQKIITSSNRQLEKRGVDNKQIINQMVRSLFENYKNLIEEDSVSSIPIKTKIQLISKKGNLVNANELYLSKSYPSGKITEKLFGDIFDGDKFISDVRNYDFDETEELVRIERFFQWLGVNKYTKFESITNKKDIQPYCEYVFNHIKKPLNYRSGQVALNGIQDFDLIIRKLSYEKLIFWIFIDDEILKQLDDRNNQDKFKYAKVRDRYGTFYYEIYVKPSYIAYQFRTSNLFNDFIIANEKLDPILNDISLDYDSEFFKRYNVNRADIESILLKIGAKDKFENLSIEKVKYVLRNLPYTSKYGKQTQKIYKLAIKHFEKNHIELDDDELLLFATKNGISDYYKINEIYYNGNIKLPKRITEKKAILNYPRRQNTTNVINFFGISDLNSLELSISRSTILDNITKEFNDFFHQITPYILVYRIKDVENDKTAKSELNKIRKISIKLCERVDYMVDNEEYSLENNDYIISGNTFLIKVDPYLSINDLRQRFDFTDTFADIIGLVFDVADTKIFRDMIKDELPYLEKLIRSEIGDDEIIRAKELLGISDEHYSFWKTIYDLKNLEFGSTSDVLSNAKIKKALSLKSDIDGIDLNHLHSYKSCKQIAFLFDELGIDLHEFNNNKYSYYKLNFGQFHKQHIKQCQNDNQKLFKLCLYKWCSENGKEGQFLDLIGIYEHSDIFIEKNQALGNKITANYQNIIENFVENRFEFQLLNTIDELIELDEIYSINKSKIDFERIDGSNYYMSLLYFDDKLSEVTDYIGLIIKQETENDDITENDVVIKPIINAKISPPSNQPNKGKRAKTPRKHSLNSDKRKKIIGNKAEKEVYDSLVKLYGNSAVEWVAQRDDTLGYDIRYKNSDAVWKYVEVKKYSNGMFYLSKNEKQFAEEHQENYELFLVEDTIYKICDVDFTGKENFILTANEYVVHYKIAT